MELDLKLRRKKDQLQDCNASAQPNLLAGQDFRKNEINRDRKNFVFAALLQSGLDIGCDSMDVNTKLWTVGIALFVLMSVILLSLYMGIYGSNEMYCIDLDGRETCYSENKNPYRYFGTKTSYEIAASNSSDDNFMFGGCAPKLFYLLCRHAARYPDKEDIEEMLEKLPALKTKIINAFTDGNSTICAGDIEKFKVWSLSMIPEYDNKVPEIGKRRTIALAQRFKKRIPTILDNNYAPHRFVFEYTSRERTKTTAEAFAEGLFGKLRVPYIQGTKNDAVLQFNKECNKLKSACNETKADSPEVVKFEKGPFVRAMLSSVSKRLGFSVNYDDVQLMYRACMFGYGLQLGDIWCSVFNRDELKILEYADDIDDYYSDAYGKAINYQQACPAAKYMVDLLNATVSSNSETKAVLQFTHAGAIKKVYAMLGLFEDKKPPTADGFCKRQNRKWRSSFIAPFNSNIAIVVLQCGSVQKKIAVFHNEQPVIVKGCHDFFCPIEDFFAQYKSTAENCDIDSVCCSCCRS